MAVGSKIRHRKKLPGKTAIFILGFNDGTHTLQLTTAQMSPYYMCFLYVVPGGTPLEEAVVPTVRVVHSERLTWD